MERGLKVRHSCISHSNKRGRHHSEGNRVRTSYWRCSHRDHGDCRCRGIRNKLRAEWHSFRPVLGRRCRYDSSRLQEHARLCAFRKSRRHGWLRIAVGSPQHGGLLVIRR